MFIGICCIIIYIKILRFLKTLKWMMMMCPDVSSYFSVPLLVGLRKCPPCSSL